MTTFGSGSTATFAATMRSTVRAAPFAAIATMWVACCATILTAGTALRIVSRAATDVATFITTVTATTRGAAMRSGIAAGVDTIIVAADVRLSTAVRHPTARRATVAVAETDHSVEPAATGRCRRHGHGDSHDEGE